MVAQTIRLPNAKKLFLPDEGKMLIDVDLERADAQVVAWEADDEELKDIFRSGADVHSENAAAIFKIPVGKVSSYQRQQAKIGIHGTNYGGSAKVIASETGMTVHEATVFQADWFSAHPSIKEWHKRVKAQLEKNRTVRNAFGYEITFMDRLDVKRLHEALAWLGQSTVAIVTNLGLINIDNEMTEVDLLLQVHDSLVMQTDLDNCPDIYPRIAQNMLIPIPYPDPLVIPVNISISDSSWGEVKPYMTVGENGSEL